MARQDEIRKTNIARYGVDNVSRLESVQAKRRRTYRAKYSSDRCEPERLELVANKIKALGYTRVLFNADIGGTTFDISVPEVSICVELAEASRDALLYPQFHQEKVAAAIAQGFRCITIYDWDDVDKALLPLAPCTTMIRAENLKVVGINPLKAIGFIHNNSCATVHRTPVNALGYYHNDELVQVATIGTALRAKSCKYELQTICTKAKTYIVSSREHSLYKELLTRIGNDGIVAYLDLSKDHPSKYSSLGMNLIQTNAPKRVWYNGVTLLSDDKRRHLKMSNTDMIEDSWQSCYLCSKQVFSSRETT